MLRDLLSFLRPDKPLLESMTQRRFESCVLGSQRPAAVFVTSKRCPLCVPAKHALQSVIPRLTHRIEFFQVDADDEKGLITQLDVQAVPTLLLFISGTEVNALLGFHSADELHTLLWSIISTGEAT